jgi:hypothetical protein
MSNTTLQKLHQQQDLDHRCRLFILQEIQNHLQITLTSVPWIPTDSEKPAHLSMAQVASPGGSRQRRSMIFVTVSFSVPCTFPLYCLRCLRDQKRLCVEFKGATSFPEQLVSHRPLSVVAKSSMRSPTLDQYR